MITIKERYERKQYKQGLKELTPIQREILYGMLLSDAFITIPRNCRQASVQFAQSKAQEDLIYHLFEVFQDWTWYPAPRITHHRRLGQGTQRATIVTQSLRFRTFSHPIFTDIHERFYPDKVAKKVIPSDVETWLTPRVLAYQLMGDGSYQHRQVFLHTEGFSLEDNHRYAQALNELLGLHCYPRQLRHGQVHYWKLVFPTKDLPLLQALIVPYLLPTFYYKLGLLFKVE